MLSCACCNAAAEPHKTVNCLICNKIFKLECADVSNTEARKIKLKGSGLTWSCKSCRSFASDINSLKSLIVGLQSEIKTLKQSVLDITPAPTASLPLLDTEKIIQEVRDRERRKCNVIIYGCQEAPVRSAEEQSGLDAETVGGIFEAIGVDGGGLRPKRLGKFDATKANNRRPIRVTLSSESAVSEVLRNANRLRSNSSFAGVFLSADRTRAQMEMYRNARAELKRRLEEGERNLKIRYIRGIPTIVSTLN